jgi:uncharacterized protein YceK
MRPKSALPKVKLLTIFLLILMVAISGCNDVTSNQLPPNTEVRVNPQEINWKINDTGGVCNFDPDYYQDASVSVMVVNEAGSYIPDAPINATLDLSENTFTGLPVLALYDDKNGNGVADGPEELVSGNTMGSYQTHTDSKTGSKMLIVRSNLSCEYKGSLYVFADGYMGSVSISVSSKEN